MVLKVIAWLTIKNIENKKNTTLSDDSNKVACGAPTYRKNEHYNIQGKSTGIVLRGGIAVVGL